MKLFRNVLRLFLMPFVFDNGDRYYVTIHRAIFLNLTPFFCLVSMPFFGFVFLQCMKSRKTAIGSEKMALTPSRLRETLGDFRITLDDISYHVRVQKTLYIRLA